MYDIQRDYGNIFNLFKNKTFHANKEAVPTNIARNDVEIFKHLKTIFKA